MIYKLVNRKREKVQFKQRDIYLEKENVTYGSD